MRSRRAVAFILNIRHNVESAKDHFGRGDVRSFAGPTVRVGRGESCECRIDDEAFLAEHFRIRFPPEGKAEIAPSVGAEVYVNDRLLEAPLRLYSGDDIRVSHWAIRFQKLYEDTRIGSGANAVAALAKILIVLILLLEIGVVGWLPYRIRRAAIWQKEIARQRNALLLDGLRYRVERNLRPENEFAKTVMEAVGDELDSRARYLRAYEGRLTPEQRRRMFEDFRTLARILDRVENGTLLQPIPEVDVDSGVQRVLHAGQRGGE